LSVGPLLPFEDLTSMWRDSVPRK